MAKYAMVALYYVDAGTPTVVIIIEECRVD
jgi:hypothetical protein